MRLSVVISALVALSSCALMAYAWTVRPADGQPQAATGMDILRDFKCRRAETKSIIVRGAEDNHSPAGNEPNFIRPDRQRPDILSFFAGGSYDQVRPDLRMTDSFKVPANVARGLFVIRLKPLANSDSDVMSIGDITSSVMLDSSDGRFGSSLMKLPELPGWTRQNELFFTDIGSISLREPSISGREAPTRTLLDFVRSGANDGWVDFFVQDDTSVDFAGLALCLEPPRGNGVSLAPWAAEPLPIKDVVAMTCVFGGRDERMCDPYIGDTTCSARLPVTCFRPEGQAMPRRLTKHGAAQIWSGGRLAFTEPVAGSSFGTVGQVNAFCTARFGGGWRAAGLLDGSTNMGIAGRSTMASPTSRVWVDALDSPYATCWARR